jgi:hypothetical protein
MYVECIRSARKEQPYEVQYLTHSFFKDFAGLTYYTSIRPGNKVGDPVVTDIKVLQYLPEGVIKVKMDFSEDFSDLPRKSRKQGEILAGGPRELYDCQLKLKASKYQHLQQLKEVIPPEYHNFFDALPC